MVLNCILIIYILLISYHAIDLQLVCHHDLRVYMYIKDRAYNKTA